MVATENDSLNGVAMLFGHLLTNTAQIFSDVRTFWSPDAVKRVTGKKLTGMASNGIIHLINSGATCMDGTGQQAQNGKPAMKPFWDITQDEVDKCLNATQFSPAIYEYFRGGGFSSTFETKGDMPVTMSRVNFVKGLENTDGADKSYMADDLVCSQSDRQRRIQRRLLGDELLGCQPWCYQFRPHRRGPHYPGFHAPDSCLHA